MNTSDINKNKYKNLKDYLDLVINQLDCCIEDLEFAANYCFENYLINNYSIEKEEILKKKNFLEQMRNDLKSIVVPQVENLSMNVNPAQEN